ncbi:MAG TPA: shikimate dehydrogenase [Candidatus Acidoferrum sp.]|nr:shikimate dehydrogenase [Candidatus Acidoferrum sp.]
MSGLPGLLGDARLRRLCAVVAAPEARAMRRQVHAALAETPTVELRLDWLRSDAERESFLRWLESQKFAKATFIATCRRVEGGGRFAGDVAAELFWLARAREAGCAWCDLEVESMREMPGGAVQVAREAGVPRRVLLSVHDFARMPPLPRWLEVAPYSDANAVKIAAQVTRFGDGLRLLRYLRSAGRAHRIVAVPMGEVGLPLRMLALREGSALAYGPVAEATAPGQVSLREMKGLYRAHELNRATNVYGVIGSPIGHSLSPLLHNTGFAARGLNAVYLPFLVDTLSEFLAAVPEIGVRGFSVTLPHKQAIMKHLKSCDSLAAEIGAVNTVTVGSDGSLHGSNTDYLGVLRALQTRMRLAKSRVLIFGAGGSARAAAFALARAGAGVVICARREVAARELARDCNGEVVPRRALLTERFDAVLNATPIGMHPHAGVSPLRARELHCRVVMDLIYRPQRTELLKIAARKGIAGISGVEMFVAQGVAQWELWTGKRAPVTRMRTAVLGALKEEARLAAQAPARSAAKKSRSRG